MCWVMPPASLGDDRRLADRVEQRRLAVVDVAHDRDDGRAGDEVGRVVLEDDLLLAPRRRVLDDDLALELGADQLDGLVGQRLRERHHLAEAHHHLDDLGGRDAERLGQVLDRDAGRHRDRPGGRLGLALGLGSRRAALAAHAPACGRPGRRSRRGACPWARAALRPGSAAGLSRPLLLGRGRLRAERAAGLFADRRFRQPSTPDQSSHAASLAGLELPPESSQVGRHWSP